MQEDINFKKPPRTPSRARISRSGFQRLDLLLLAIESIDVNAPQIIVTAIRQLDLVKAFPNTVELWKFRCNNPMRKASIRVKASRDSEDSILLLLSFLSDHFYPRLRQLLSTKESTLENEKRWTSFKTRLNELIEERMNISREAVKSYLKPNNNEFYKEIIFSLALSSGPGGMNRLRASLMDNYK
ncbi:MULTISPECIES: DUF3038 domain-containing protein [Prochlorococcus]|uniref:DUF3038 domain-containing protein n=1 Tax=Prochlorococcus TaxID=1218 RepID=UPI00056235F6|nr:MULTISPECIES: DUF3038 domain-containing protein [Prochlorococcus]